METLRISSKELQLPSYMTALPQSVTDSIVRLQDVAVRVVAAGVDPKDSCLMLVTGEADVRQIKPNGKLIPCDASPSGDGQHITVTFRDIDRIYAIESKLAIQNSESCLGGATLSLNGVELGAIELDQT